MKNLVGLCLIIGLISIGVWQKDTIKKQHMPIPTNGKTMVKSSGDDEEGQELRKAWLDLMHQAAPGTNWKALEYQNMCSKVEQKRRTGQNNNRNGLEDLANGNLIGEWFEKGSSNQAGSVIATEYDPISDEIYLIAAGGTLFKGSSAGNSWEVLNQEYRFDGNFLQFIETPIGKRLLAYISDQPHYSDDFGNTWTMASGIPVEDSWANNKNTTVMEGLNQQIYVLSKKSYWDDYILYQSKDFGQSYTPIQNMGSSNADKFAMSNPHHTNELLIIQSTGYASSKLSRVDFDNEAIVDIYENNSVGFHAGRTNLASTLVGDSVKLIIWNEDLEVLESFDYGENWKKLSTLETRPWNVGIYISPSDPYFFTMGAVECYRSFTGGSSWQKVNEWGEYYGDVVGKLHADMMFFKEFEKTDGTKFTLNSNHGGLNVTTDNYNTINNLGLFGLNVSQYYDVVSMPGDPSLIFAGTQDQGFQRSQQNDLNDPALFEQVISGDYGHIVFSENNSHLWTVYPGGWVTYYDDPMGYLTASWEVISASETVWIPPLMPSPDPSENAIYLAGGNTHGGNGSHLIKLTYNPLENKIDTAQLDYNFESYSVGGTISMMRTSPINPEKWYVSTTNGRFFYSADSGISWEQCSQFLPDAHYLYGSTIYPSKLDENVVYMAGTGYSNPAVYRSDNGGETFVPMNEGLPSTLVYELTANPEETMFFAATESGPYIYVVEEAMWYDMSGITAPNQTYWSVEYIESLDRVRFGTYGRGAWDFQIESEVSSNNLQEELVNVDLFPNPTSSILNIELKATQSKALSFKIFDISGKLMLERKESSQKGQDFSALINVEQLNSGQYILEIRDGRRKTSRKFTKL